LTTSICRSDGVIRDPSGTFPSDADPFGYASVDLSRFRGTQSYCFTTELDAGDGDAVFGGIGGTPTTAYSGAPCANTRLTVPQCVRHEHTTSEAKGQLVPERLILGRCGNDVFVENFFEAVYVGQFVGAPFDEHAITCSAACPRP
jgi:hypothetical protein